MNTFEIFKRDLDNNAFQGVNEKRATEILQRLVDEDINNISSAFNFIQNGGLKDIQQVGKLTIKRLLDRLTELESVVVIEFNEQETNILNQYTSMKEYDTKSEFLKDVIKEEFSL